MDQDIVDSRLRISRRRALGLGGTVGLGALLAACRTGTDTSTPTEVATSEGTTTLAPTTTSGADLVARLDALGSCTLAQEETQGPYWFDVDSIRSDIREDRPGTPLVLALRVQDATCRLLPNTVVEIWHCDAGGVYSGFEVSSRGAGGGGPGGVRPTGGPGGAAPGGDPARGTGETSDGSYSQGVTEADAADDGTYLRGAQVADAHGIVQFTTLYPGWYRGRTVHIHLKVHVDRANVLTSQLFFDDDLSESVYTAAPYGVHTGRDTHNADDSIFEASGALTVAPTTDGYLALHNLALPG